MYLAKLKFSSAPLNGAPQIGRDGLGGDRGGLLATSLAWLSF